MWILLTVSAAFFNALWTSLSKRRLVELSPFRFTLVFRALTALLMTPVFLYDFKVSARPVFWLAVAGAGALEVIGVYAQSIGIKRDFYSTYSMSNTTPLFTLFIAPLILPEKINLALAAGALCMTAGGIIFYRMSRRISIYGIIRAVSMAAAGILAKIAIGYSSGLSYPFIIFTTAICLMMFLSPMTKEPVKWDLFIRFGKKLFPLAVFSAAASLLYYSAVQTAPITRVNPLIRVNLIFGFLLSYYFLKERGNIKRKITAGILIGAGAVLISISR